MTINISNMLKPEVYDHPAKNIELIETHISWVILTGDFAYKIKKPVNFGFLDFSTLNKRQHYCEQELRLNRRLAPTIYLDVVSICGTKTNPVIKKNGHAFEYAVKMRQFPQAAQLDHMLTAGKIGMNHMDVIARMVANFHHTAEISNESTEYGSNALIYQPVEENFQQIHPHVTTADYTKKLNALDQWCQAEFIKLESVFQQRKQCGFIRECHGDMHLRNMLWLNKQAIAFDCIEFNEKLRRIDVISEIAFLIMDLQHRHQAQLANRFLNSYLEVTGDYAGVTVLPFYLCYRALVRAKVNALRLAQKHLATEEKESIIEEFTSYLELALTYTQRPGQKLIIMCGLSASGKSTVSQKLLDAIPAIRLRSDVERKRLFKSASSNTLSSNIDTNIYSEDATRQTYEKLIELASMIIDAGYSVIVDATFLQHAQRKLFQQLAKQLHCPFIILQLSATEEVLRQRIMQRNDDISDADLAVLEQQLANQQPLQPEEGKASIHIDTDEPLDVSQLIKRINKSL